MLTSRYDLRRSFNSLTPFEVKLLPNLRVVGEAVVSPKIGDKESQNLVQKKFNRVK